MPEIKVKLKPFRVPNYVLVDDEPRSRGEGYTDTPKYHLSQLSQETLEELCAEFREGVLRKARGEEG